MREMDAGTVNGPGIRQWLNPPRFLSRTFDDAFDQPVMNIDQTSAARKLNVLLRGSSFSYIDKMAVSRAGLLLGARVGAAVMRMLNQSLLLGQRPVARAAA